MKGKEKLLSLEKENKFVFHGSPDTIKVLEPMQGKNDDPKSNKMESEKPAVFATPYAEISIFRALINSKNVKGKSKSSFGIKGKQKHFSATKNLLEEAKKKIGKVYVLDKHKFKNFDGMQCRSEEPVTPVEIVEVTIKDLPKGIKVITEKIDNKN